ncbi:unnamed protein product [Porites evermanni]|uniref:Uncharacterized protein n=1 Tax=Porites evermanni TaxID=104178 RepID=A0ABN8MBW9_9CNID|nr:unnamed protein product [Porites evermanni]
MVAQQSITGYFGAPVRQPKKKGNPSAENTGVIEKKHCDSPTVPVRKFRGFHNVLKYSTELSKQGRHETDTMDMSAQTNVCIGADERLHQLGHIRKEKIFLPLFTVTALLCGALL